MKTLLILDNATTHKTSRARDNVKESEATLLVILSSLIWILQSLDIRITKCLKKFKKQTCRLLNWQKQYKRIKECNHKVDWWIMHSDSVIINEMILNFLNIQ